MRFLDKRTPRSSDCHMARNPSHLISNSQSGFENGSGQRLSQTGWNCGNGKRHHKTSSNRGYRVMVGAGRLSPEFRDIVPQAIPLTGTATAVPNFNLSASPASSTVTAGQQAVYKALVIPVGGFNQTVSLSCTGARPQLRRMASSSSGESGPPPHAYPTPPPSRMSRNQSSVSSFTPFARVHLGHQRSLAGNQEVSDLGLLADFLRGQPSLNLRFWRHEDVPVLAAGAQYPCATSDSGGTKRLRRADVS